MVVPLFRTRGRFSSAPTQADEDGGSTASHEGIESSPKDTVSSEAAPGAKSLFRNLFRKYSDVEKTADTAPLDQDQKKDKRHVRPRCSLFDLSNFLYSTI